MKLIIAGGRDFKPCPDDYWMLTKLHQKHSFTEIVSGGCSGADAFGEEWAKSIGLPVKRFNADWQKHGRAAGPIRNVEMAKYADAVILFPGGRGTDDMHKKALAAGIQILDYRGSK